MLSKENLINSIFIPRKYHTNDDKDIFIKTEDNTKIAVRAFISNPRNPTILLFHGNGEIANDYDDIGHYYNKFNINLIVSDYRGYGLSEGIPNKNNLHADSLLVFDYVKSYLTKIKSTNKLIVMGRSLGSASAAHIIEHKSEALDGCIVESGFATEFPLLSLMNINPDEISFKLSDGFNNLKKFKRYNKPLFIIHADLDNIVPFSQAEMIMLECPTQNKNIFVINGANHNNLMMYARQEYFKKIQSFIDSI